MSGKSSLTLAGVSMALAVALTSFNVAHSASEGASNVVNPLATADQNEVEARALKILQTPEVQKAKALAELRWKGVLQTDPPAEAWPSFNPMMDDYVFNYILKAANSDPNYPKIVHVYTPPHKWQGMEAPGSRWGGDNPDNVYRIIPIDAKAHYRLDGRRIGAGPANVTYTLVGDWETSKTLNGIEGRDVPVGPDGEFEITIGPEPANGRPNHIQTKPGARLLFIRDSLGDWNQKANALSIHRLDPPDAPPISDQQVAERAADMIVDGVPRVYWFLKYIHGTPNIVAPLQWSNAVGGLASQMGSTANLMLNPDEAFIVTLQPAQAQYASVVAHNYWFITLPYATTLSSLNQDQATHNVDGSITFVVAGKDPGVHNWIDTSGLRNTLLVIRVQGLVRDDGQTPSVKGQLVKIADLKSVLPKETVSVSPAQRQTQIAERTRAVAIRMADH